MLKDSDKNLVNKGIFKRPHVDNTYMKEYPDILNLPNPKVRMTEGGTKKRVNGGRKKNINFLAP